MVAMADLLWEAALRPAWDVKKVGPLAQNLQKNIKDFASP
jgi:hypothetical protein